MLVAQSLGAFSAPLACDHAPVKRLVLVNPMIPRPAEAAGEWWEAVGWADAAHASAERNGRPAPDVSDLDTVFFHDLPSDLVESMRSDPQAAVEGPTVFTQPWPLAGWPGVPLRCCPVARIACSRSSYSEKSPANAWDSMSKRFPAGTSSPSANPLH